MRRIYTVLLYTFIPALIIRLLWKSRRLPEYRQRMSERFQIGVRYESSVDVWIHAVSLGEVVAITSVIEALLKKNQRIMVTTMTPTGSKQVNMRFGTRVQHQYLPYDLPWVLRRFFKAINPKVGLIMETELWPNLIMEGSKRFPLYLANARLSDKAYQSYFKSRILFKPIVRRFTKILAQSEEDACRYIELGASSNNVFVAGNLKFDININNSPSDSSQQLQMTWGKGRVVLIAASTHDDEESQLLNCLNELKQHIPSILLLIAPRHPERFLTVYKLSNSLGFNTKLRSKPSEIDSEVEVIILDSLGELLSFYQLSDYAFVGGSLVPIGGHNLLEPIAMKVPVLTGIYMNNSKAIFQILQAQNAVQMIKNSKELVGVICAMHKNQQIKQRQIANASAVLTANRGATNRVVSELEVALKERSS